MGLGSRNMVQQKHEKLWVDEVVELQYRLLVLNEIRAFQALDPPKPIKFHGIVLYRFLNDRELDNLRERGTSFSALFVRGGNPYSDENA